MRTSSVLFYKSSGRTPLSITLASVSVISNEFLFPFYPLFFKFLFPEIDPCACTYDARRIVDSFETKVSRSYQSSFISFYFRIEIFRLAGRNDFSLFSISRYSITVSLVTIFANFLFTFL